MSSGAKVYIASECFGDTVPSGVKIRIAFEQDHMLFNYKQLGQRTDMHSYAPVLTWQLYPGFDKQVATQLARSSQGQKRDMKGHNYVPFMSLQGNLTQGLVTRLGNDTHDLSNINRELHMLLQIKLAKSNWGKGGTYYVPFVSYGKVTQDRVTRLGYGTHGVSTLQCG